MKTCTKCAAEKPFDEFTFSKGKYVAACKKCVREFSAKWYAANKEKALASSKEWFEANKERKHATSKAWDMANKEKRAADAAARYAKNKESILARSRELYYKNIEKERKRGSEYAKKNAGAHRARVAKYRASKMLRTPSWLTESDKLRINCYYQVAVMRSKESGFDWEVDHIVPLQGETVSGLHVPCNLQVIPKSSNRSKGNRL